MYAFDTTERVQIGRRSREWTAVHGTQEGCLREMARCLRENAFDLSLACGRGYAEDAVWSHNGGQAAASRGETRSYYFSPLRQWLRRGVEDDSTRVLQDRTRHPLDTSC